MKARGYQISAIDAPFNHYKQGYTGNPLLTMPTGTGKSFVICGIIKKIFDMSPGARVLKLVHSKILVEQNYKTFLRIWPQAPAGIYSAGLKRKETHYPITFAGIQSIYKKASVFKHIDVVVIDEAHLINPITSNMYMDFLNNLKKINPKLAVIGLTATDYRLQYGYIWGQEDSLFERKCIDMTSMDAFNWFVDEGYLVSVVARKPSVEIDLSGVGVRGGEFIESDLQKALNKDEITIAAIEQCIENYKDLDKWLIFCSGIEHAERTAELLNQYGIKAEAMHSKRTDEENTETLRRLNAGEIQVITNNNQLTTGFDCPALKIIIILRPTMSASLWVQMVGRLTRPNYAPGYDLWTTRGRLDAIANSDKPYGIVADFTNNSLRLGCINDPLIPKRKGEKGSGEPVVKLCSNVIKDTVCATYNHGTARFCVACGFEFEFKVKIKQEEAGRDLVKRKKEAEIQIHDAEIYSINMSRQKGYGDKPDTLKVCYSTTIGKVNKFVSIEHDRGSPAWWHASKWWKINHTKAMPSTINEALEMLADFKVPTHIRVNKTGKYPEILAYCYDGSNFGVQEPDEVRPEIVADTIIEDIENLLNSSKKEADVLPFDESEIFEYSDDDDIPF